MIDIPELFHDMLNSRAVAFVSTIGKRGEPQVTPLWFLWDGARVRISLVEGRQKLRNLRRDPRIAMAIADPARPTFDLPPDGISLEDQMESIGKIFMLKALERTGGVQTQAAELLRMSFRSFRYYAKKYELIARDRDGEPEVLEVEEK